MQELSSSEKDYMEAIYILQKQSGEVRSIDVANYLGHSRPSITKAVTNLCNKGYLVKLERRLMFTATGRLIAERIITRHCILIHTLKEMGIDEPTAIIEAQQIERVISEHTVKQAAVAIQCQKMRDGICPLHLQ